VFRRGPYRCGDRMAEAYPERVPKAWRHNAARVFYERCLGLPGSYTVFGWIQVYHDGQEREIDCLVFRRGWGWLVVEVKGGRLRYRPELGKWQGKRRPPDVQAREAMHLLERVLKEKLRASVLPCNYGWAIALPEAHVTGDVAYIPRAVDRRERPPRARACPGAHDAALGEGEASRVCGGVRQGAWGPEEDVRAAGGGAAGAGAPAGRVQADAPGAD